MSLFHRSILKELFSHTSVVFSTLVIVWISILLVRLIGDASVGKVGIDAVLSIAAFSSINALPTIILVSVFIGVLSTVTRNYRESEMVVWFASGRSLLAWMRPVLIFSMAAGIFVLMLTFFVTPWMYQKINDYKDRYAQRSDVTRIAPGQFGEMSGGDRVFYVESADLLLGTVNRVFIRSSNDQQGQTLVSASSGRIEEQPNGDRFIVLKDGQRYDLTMGSPSFRMMGFAEYGSRIESKASYLSNTNSTKQLPVLTLLNDFHPRAQGELLWRIGLPIMTINLALLAIPLGAVNPRLGRSGDLLLAFFIAFLYLNLTSLMHSWVNNERLSFWVAVWVMHVIVLLITSFYLWLRIRVKKPRH